MKSQTKNHVNLQVRMPKPLRDKLVALAKAYGRSLNGEVLYRLTLAVEYSERPMQQEEWT